jgi:L-ascorbate metabolism protein UlaG (beta-lactamase superfamily)
VPVKVLCFEIQHKHGKAHSPNMKQTWHGHSAFRIEAAEAKMLIDPFLSDNPSRDNGWSGYLTGKNSTQGGDR